MPEAEAASLIRACAQREVSVEKLQDPAIQMNGNGRIRLPEKRPELPTHRMARLLAEQEADGRPVLVLEESDYVAVLEERDDVPLLVALQRTAWQPKPPAPLRKWPMFLSVFSSFGVEVLHRHSAENDAQISDQVELYVVLSGSARLMVPYGQGKVAVYQLLPHSVAVVYPNAYHYITWDEPGFGLVFRSPNYGPESRQQFGMCWPRLSLRLEKPKRGEP
jgi:hypothetical protein